MLLFISYLFGIHVHDFTPCLQNCKEGHHILLVVSDRYSTVSLKLYAGFVRVLENLESPGISLWHFPGLESPGKRPLVLESPGNL